MTINITVYAIPGPQGSKKAIGTGTTADGHSFTRMAESSKKVRPWRKAVEKAATAAYRGAPLDCPLRVRMVFTMPKPASAPKRKQTWPMRYPDVSKLCRATEDALTKAGVWKDDARVCEYERLAKVFPNEDPEALASPGVRIEIRVLAEVVATAPLFQQSEVAA